MVVGMASSVGGPMTSAPGSAGSGSGVNNHAGTNLTLGVPPGSAFGTGPVASASETDGDTFDGDADFDEYEDWDYAEMLSMISKNLKTYVFQPLVVGAAAAFGMSIGYAVFDATSSIFTRRSSHSSRSR